MEDKRAHERINSLEQVMADHIESHAQIEKAITENTDLTRTISENTGELVALVKGIKGFRAFTLWIAPFVVALLALWAWLKAQASS